MNKKTFPLLLATAMVLGACSNDTLESGNVEVTDDANKTRIALSAGDDNSIATTRAGFTNQTRIVARIVSDKRGGGDAKCVKTFLSAAAETSVGTFSKVSYVSGNTRYWDDAYGRSSILSVYAIAIPNKYDDTDGNKLDNTTIKGTTTWATENASNDNVSWSVSTTQTTTTLADENLAYSNNIQNGNVGGNSVYTWSYSDPEGYPAEDPANATKHGTAPNIDGRLYFTQSAAYNAELNDGPGHFDKGQMEFKHALTRIQVNLLKGTGYDATPFTSTAIELLGQSVSGTFNIKNAAWSDKAAATPINMAKWGSPADGKVETYEAQVLPGYEFVGNTTNVLKVTIDGNKPYFVTNAMLRTALNEKVDDDYTTKMATRYVFDVTVTKTGIQNITATIVDWNEITAANTTVDNSHLSFSFYEGGTVCTSGVNLYKFEQTLSSIVTTDDSYEAAPVAGSAYTEVALVGSEAPYKTNEYYKDNKTAYHFRSINDAAETALNGGKTAFTMTSGTTDYHWGAPLIKGITSIPYNETNGYLSNIAKGIVSASQESQIKITEINMMSQLVVKLETPSAAEGGIDLTDAEVYLTRFKATGDVDMSTGKITPTSSITTSSAVFTAVGGETDTYYFNVIPQDLVRNEGESDDDYIGITIHTKDNNEYYVVKKLSEIIGTVGSQATNMQTAGKITKWYPGHKYVYTFTITKTPIKNITATLVDWNIVEGANTNLDLEK